MPGRHAPKSPLSFYLSLGRAIGGVLGAIALVVLLAVVAFGNRGEKAKLDAGPSITAGSTVPSVSSAPIDTATPSPSPSVRPPEQITLTVLNGDGRVGLATRAKNKLHAYGYQVPKIGNAPTTEHSTIFYQPGYEAEAMALKQAFPAFTLVKPADASVSSATNMTLILGRDYPKTD